MPLISIVMPVYNGEKTIQETLDSALQQTFTDFELIAVNDGSTDGTLEILNTIQDARVKVISQPSRGSYPARNLGIQHAEGEFIAFLDADDLWTADKLESQLEALQANPTAAAAYSWTMYIDIFGQPLNGGCYITKSGDILPDLLQGNFIATGSNPLIRKEALDTVGFFDESFPTAGDWELWLRLAQRYHFVVVPKPQIQYRRTNHSWSADILRQEEWSRKVIEKAFKQAPASLQVLKKSSKAALYHYLVYRIFEIYPGPRSYLPGRKEAITAIRFLWHAIYHKPANILNKRFLFISCFNIISAILLSPEKAYRLRCSILNRLERSKLT